MRHSVYCYFVSGLGFIEILSIACPLRLNLNLVIERSGKDFLWPYGVEEI